MGSSRQEVMEILSKRTGVMYKTGFMYEGMKLIS